MSFYLLHFYKSLLDSLGLLDLRKNKKKNMLKNLNGFWVRRAEESAYNFKINLGREKSNRDQWGEIGSDFR